MIGSERVSCKRKPRTCPTCGHRQIARILYGLYDQPVDERVYGLITYGGCCVTNDDPAWECLACGSTFYREKP